MKKLAERTKDFIRNKFRKWINEKLDKWIDQRIDERIDQKINDAIEKRIEEKINQWIDQRLDQWIDRKIDERLMRIYGEIEPKSPRISIMGRPWFNAYSYYKPFRSDSFQASMEFDTNRRKGVLKFPLQDLSGNYLKMVTASAGVVEVRVPQESEVNLENGDNFTARGVAKIRVPLQAPVEISTRSIEYGRGILSIPITVKSLQTLDRVKPVSVSPPEIGSARVRLVNLPVLRRTRWQYQSSSE